MGLDKMGVDAVVGSSEAVCACFAHNDHGRHLSINIAEKAGLWRCWVCPARGIFEEFIAQYKRCTFVQASIAARVWSRAAAYEPPPTIIPPKPKPPQEDRLAQYRFRHPYALTRGVSEETLQRFDVGCDRSKNMVTFPWFAQTDNLVGFKWRAVDRKFYLNEKGVDFSSTFFGFQHVRQHAWVWIGEGEFDTMTLDQNFRLGHFTNHYAIGLGGKYLHNNQIDALCRKQPEAVVLMLDNDEAGQQAQADIYRRLLPRVKTLQATYPPGIHDPNGLSFSQIRNIAMKLEEENGKRLLSSPTHP